MTQYGGGGGRTGHFFLLTLYNFKTIGGGARAPPPTPYSMVPVFLSSVIPLTLVGDELLIANLTIQCVFVEYLLIITYGNKHWILNF